MAAVVTVDVSLALKWVLNEPFTAEAVALETEWERLGTRRVAPSLFAVEAANALYQRVRQNVLSLADAERALVALLENGPELVLDSALSSRALTLAHQLGLTQVYDSH